MTAAADGPRDPAALLDEAARLRRSIEPFGPSLGQEPYRVQAAVVRRRSRRLGSEPIGYKVALTSPETQSALRTSEPASGRLLVADVIPSGSVLSLQDMFSPVLEAELVFRVREDLPAGASTDQIAQQCDVAAGLECPDSRYVDWFGGAYPKLDLDDVIADNCLTGLVVVGATWLPAAAVDLPTVTTRLLVQGEEVASGAGTAVLGDPLRSMAWLSARLSTTGEILPAGTVVSAGTLTPPLVVRPGPVRCVFSAGLGDVCVEFT